MSTRPHSILQVISPHTQTHPHAHQDQSKHASVDHSKHAIVLYQPPKTESALAPNKKTSDATVLHHPRKEKTASAPARQDHQSKHASVDHSKHAVVLHRQLKTVSDPAPHKKSSDAMVIHHPRKETTASAPARQDQPKSAASREMDHPNHDSVVQAANERKTSDMHRADHQTQDLVVVQSAAKHQGSPTAPMDRQTQGSSVHQNPSTDHASPPTVNASTSSSSDGAARDKIYAIQPCHVKLLKQLWENLTDSYKLEREKLKDCPFPDNGIDKIIRMIANIVEGIPDNANNLSAMQMMQLVLSNFSEFLPKQWKTLLNGFLAAEKVRRIMSGWKG